MKTDNGGESEEVDTNEEGLMCDVARRAENTAASAICTLYINKQVSTTTQMGESKADSASMNPTLRLFRRDGWLTRRTARELYICGRAAKSGAGRW